MRRLSNWIAGIITGVIAYRLWKGHQRPEPATSPVVEPEPDDRAEELRAKLAEARATEEPAPPPEPPAGPSEPPAGPSEPSAEPSGESLEDRRRRVHEEGRAAIDRMNDI